MIWVIDDNAVTYNLKSQQRRGVVQQCNINCIPLENANKLGIEVYHPLTVFRLRDLIG